MSPRSTSQVEHAGENAVAATVSQLGWFYRHKPRPDFGLDGELEGPTEEGTPNFRFIGVQVKSGASYFSRPYAAGWWLDVEPKHLSLWLQSSLPIIVVMHNPDTKQTYWQSVERQNLRRTPRGFLLSIPAVQVLDASALEQLSQLANAGLPPVQPGDAELERLLRVRRAESDFGWMASLGGDADVCLEIEEQLEPLHNIHVRLYDNEPLGREDEAWDELLADTASVADEVTKHFPWATLSVDERTYAQHDRIKYVAECGTWDAATEGYDFAEDFDKWSSRQPSGLRHYAETLDGNLRLWRLKLRLNEFGEAQLRELEDAEMDAAQADALDDLFTDIPEWGDESHADPYYEGDAVEAGPGGLHSVERLVFWAGESDVLLAAEDGLWTDPEKRDVLAAALLTHATGKAPTRGLADAFFTRFGSVIPDPDYGVWTLQSSDVDDWLHELGA